MRLDLRGRDEIAAEPQHVSHSRLEDEAAVAYEAPEIAGSQPTVLSDGSAGRLIVTKIAGHQARPADLDLTAFPLRQETTTLWVADAHSVIVTAWKAAGSCALRDGRLWALPRKERLHLAHAVEPAKTDAASSGFDSDFIHRRVEGGEEARAQGRERFGGGTDGKKPREHRRCR